MKNKYFPVKIAVFLIVLAFILAGAASAGPPAPIDDEDDLHEGPEFYLPSHPRIKEMHLKTMELALENSELMITRSLQQQELAMLETGEARAKHLRLKREIEYYKMRDLIHLRMGNLPEVEKMLLAQDGKMDKIKKMVRAEEKIDCFHTIFERRHKAMEEYHWNLIDEKHPLIAEYLEDLDYEKYETQFHMLYSQMLSDYVRIGAENRQIITETDEIIKQKKERDRIIEEINREQIKLLEEIKPLYEKALHEK